MIKLAIFLLVLSFIAALFGYSGLAAGAAGIAKIIFFIAIVGFLVLLVVAFAIGKTFW
jgi:uncharacterized membrane protein YtjA (UPF0391 family)